MPEVLPTTNRDSPPLSSYSNKLVAECIGTYVLVLTIGCNVLGNTGVFAVVSIAFALMVVAEIFKSVSGSQFNPAVTFGLVVAGKMGAYEGGLYVASQIVGGLLGALTYVFLFDGQTFNLDAGKGHNWLAAATVELLYTCMLVTTVLNVKGINTKKENNFFPLTLALVILSGGYAVGSISGGCFNPAVAIAIDVTSFQKNFGMCLTYTVAECLGAALAVLGHRLVRPEEYGGKNQSSDIHGGETVPRFVAEFIGTYFITITMGFNVLKGSTASAFSLGAAIAAGIYNFSCVSGAHFNPALTLAHYLSRREKISAHEALVNVAAQLLGAVAAGLTYVAVLGQSIPLNAGSSWGRTTVADIIFTGVVCFVFLRMMTVSGYNVGNPYTVQNGNVNPHKSQINEFFGFVIAGAFISAGFAGSSLGVSLNPAVGFGVDFSNAVKGGTFGHSILFAGMEVIGSALGVGAFMTVFPEEYTAGK